MHEWMNEWMSMLESYIDPNYKTVFNSFSYLKIEMHYIYLSSMVIFNNLGPKKNLFSLSANLLPAFNSVN